MVHIGNGITGGISMEDKGRSPRKWDKINDKIQNKWLKNKKTVIHHMRRPHIVSSILAFLLLIAVTAFCS